MSDLMRGRKVKVRKATTKEGYAQVTVPKILLENTHVNVGDEVTPIFGDILVYVPEGKDVDEELLKKAIKKVSKKNDQ